MILTDYYCFEKVAAKSKMRLDCTASTRSYDEFEGQRKREAQQETAQRDAFKVGALLVYYGDVPIKYRGDVHRKADKKLTIGSKNLSSIYRPDVSLPFAYGDMRGTSDALLFVSHNFNVKDRRVMPNSRLEIFVARGKARDKNTLYNLLSEGELEAEMQALREAAKKE